MLTAAIPCKSYSTDTFPPFRVTAYEILESLNANSERAAIFEGEVHLVLLWHNEPRSRILVEWMGGTKTINEAQSQLIDEKTRRSIHTMSLLQHAGIGRKHRFRISLLDPETGKKREQHEIPMDVNFA